MDLPKQLEIESWCLYATGIVIVACRMISRRMKLGKWSLLEIDDYLMMFVLVCFTMVTFSINEVAKNGSNYMSTEAYEALDADGIKQAIYGSKMTFILEVFTLTATWTIKICLLIFYSRLIQGTNVRQKMVVKIAFGYVGLTYLLTMFLMIFYWCQPVTGYWAVPYEDSQCATYYHHMIFATACNISSDILLFTIPLPIIIKTKLPLKRKIILIGIFGLGAFNILVAILNRYYNFSNPNSYVFLFWYVAEVGIAVYVGNLPFCWPLFRLALGHKGDTSARSHPGQRGSFYRKPTLHSNSPNTAWNKLDDGDDFMKSAEPKRAGTGTGTRGSDSSSSQIELVEARPHHKSMGSTDSHPQQASTVARADGGDAQHSRSPPGDKIMVTTVVDISR